jgi:hypothetical protein
MLHVYFISFGGLSRQRMQEKLCRHASLSTMKTYKPLAWPKLQGNRDRKEKIVKSFFEKLNFQF